MTILETLALLVTRDLCERRERPSGRFYYVEFDIGGHVLSLRHKYDALTAERDQLRARVAELEAGLECVEDLISNSDGVTGLHMNGDIAPWDDLRTGGRFEQWLSSFDTAIGTDE